MKGVLDKRKKRLSKYQAGNLSKAASVVLRELTQPITGTNDCSLSSSPSPDVSDKRMFQGDAQSQMKAVRGSDRTGDMKPACPSRRKNFRLAGSHQEFI